MLAGHRYERMRYDRIIAKLPPPPSMLARMFAGASRERHWTLRDVAIVGNDVFYDGIAAEATGAGSSSGRTVPAAGGPVGAGGEKVPGRPLMVSDHFGLFATYEDGVP
jgi:hypothetical protein